MAESFVGVSYPRVFVVRTSPRLLAALVLATLGLTADTAQAQTPDTWTNTTTDGSWTANSWSATTPDWSIAGLTTSYAVFGPQTTGGLSPIIGSTPLFANGVSFDNSGTASWDLGSTGQSLSLGSGGLSVTGGGNTTSTVSADLVLMASQTWNIADNTALAFNGNFTRNVGATIEFNTNASGSITTSSLSNTFGILGGYATIGNDWAGVDTSNPTKPIIALAAYDTSNDPNYWFDHPNLNVKISDSVALSNSTTINSLNFATGSPLLDLSGSYLTITSGGILASLSGTIKGDGSITTSSVQPDLIVIAKGSATVLTIESIIQDRVDDNQDSVSTGLTKSGSGTLVLTGANSYSGPTTINAGSLALTGSASIDFTPTITVGTGSTFSVGAVTGGYTLGVNNPQTLGGTGTVTGAVTVLLGATIRGDTGTGVGTLTVSDVTVTSGGNIAANIGVSGSSSNLAVGTNILNLHTGSILQLSSVSGFNPLNSGSYTIASLSVGNLQLDGVDKSNGFSFGSYTQGVGASGAVIIDVAGVSGLVDGNSFALTMSDGNLVLNFTPTPVPESSAVLGIAAGALAVGGLVRRRLRKPSETTTAV